MTPDLLEAIRAQQRALADLERAQVAVSAWPDAAQSRLALARLETLSEGGLQLLAALRVAAHSMAVADGR